MTQYKNEGGEQQTAYDILHLLYIEYAGNGEDEAKMDCIADILDSVCGWTNSLQYELWNNYLFDIPRIIDIKSNELKLMPKDKSDLL